MVQRSAVLPIACVEGWSASGRVVGRARARAGGAGGGRPRRRRGRALDADARRLAGEPAAGQLRARPGQPARAHPRRRAAAPRPRLPVPDHRPRPPGGAADQVGQTSSRWCGHEGRAGRRRRARRRRCGLRAVAAGRSRPGAARRRARLGGRRHRGARRAARPRGRGRRCGRRAERPAGRGALRCCGRWWCSARSPSWPCRCSAGSARADNPTLLDRPYWLGYAAVVGLVVALVVLAGRRRPVAD